MNKSCLYIKTALLPLMMLMFSCNNDQNEKKAPDITKDSVQTKSGEAEKNDTATIKKNDAANTPALEKPKSKDSSSTSTANIKKAEKKIKEKKSSTRDSANATKKDATEAIKKDNAVTTTPTTKPANVGSGPTVFKAKYGIIPRDATESNITGFVNAFPDKSTIIKVNFDGPADAEMNSVKAQITKVLKKLGYTNVQSQSATIEPQRMPKEIHYELQRDGSVVFWVQPANQEQ